MPALSNLRANIQALMRAKELTQTSLAEQVGIHRVDFNNFLHGRKDINFDTAERIAKALGVRLSYLIEEPEPAAV